MSSFPSAPAAGPGFGFVAFARQPRNFELEHFDLPQAQFAVGAGRGLQFGEKRRFLAQAAFKLARLMIGYLKTRPVPLDVYLSKADVGSEFGVKSIPALYILDKEGQVAFNSAGAYPFEMLDSVIAQLVKG